MVTVFLKYDGKKPEPGQRIAISKNGKVKAAIYNTKNVIGNRAIQEPEDTPYDSILAILKQKFTLVFSHGETLNGFSKTPLPKDIYEDQIEEDADGFLQLKNTDEYILGYIGYAGEDLKEGGVICQHADDKWYNKKTKCTEICADPDLILDKQPKKAQWDRINKCTKKDEFICRWTK